MATRRSVDDRGPPDRSPGAWYWLTVGRPPLVAEVVAGWVSGGEEPHNLAVGSRAARPVFNEPAAAAVGLRRAGVDLELEVVVRSVSR